MQSSARNHLKGKVKALKKDQIMAEVIIDLGSGQEIVSTITAHSAEKLGLAVGKEVYAVIKASSVMVNVE